MNRDFSQWGKFSRNNLIALLGGDKDRLPSSHGTALLDGGFQVYVKPLGERTTHKRRFSLRLTIICTCGKHIPAGRMGQHLRRAGHV
jgi:hypothetical protein